MAWSLVLNRRGQKGWKGREPIWACYGDLGLAVDNYRPIAPSAHSSPQRRAASNLDLGGCPVPL